jgi:hypothetical protein
MYGFFASSTGTIFVVVEVVGFTLHLNCSLIFFSYLWKLLYLGITSNTKEVMKEQLGTLKMKRSQKAQST